MGVVKDVFEGIGDVLTGGAISAKKERKKARRAAREASEQAEQESAEERRRRRNIQRSALQNQPSLFDLLSGPDA